MTDRSSPSDDERSDDSNTYWAKPISRWQANNVPPGALNLNVEGRRAQGALQGFGQLWQRTYRVYLRGVKSEPAEVMRVWKDNFSAFQPPGNHFFAPLRGVKPGEVMFIDTNLSVGPGLPGMIPIASRVMILYADEESFTIMTPMGFPVAGWNTFSTSYEDGCPVAQVQSLERAADPIYEFGYRFLGGEKQQEATWTHVLQSLASYYRVGAQISITRALIDPNLQWLYAKNIWHNAGVRTSLYKLSAPLRWFSRLFFQK